MRPRHITIEGLSLPICKMEIEPHDTFPVVVKCFGSLQTKVHYSINCPLKCIDDAVKYSKAIIILIVHIYYTFLCVVTNSKRRILLLFSFCR